MLSRLRRIRDKRATHGRESGAALVEAAIVMPVLMIIVFGIIEMGLLFRDYLTLTNMTRTGVRVGSAASLNPDSDYRTLKAATSSGTAISLSDVNYVIVFKAQDASGNPITKPPAPCFSGSQSGECNRYVPSQFNLGSSSFGCGSGCVDGAYSPTDRFANMTGNGPDRLGVYISMRHHWITGFFGSAVNISDSTIMRLEPAT